ncbi:Armadillo-like helical [Fusarium mundagurra]|uniref:Armadillo-like helical n=1 Tax=Fusarium mundagurra TaxID=1567541 RepID=A0A8H5YP53_9HYPO|nr:Armadillo-like helical [Fusarium mundagurra]
MPARLWLDQLEMTNLIGESDPNHVSEKEVKRHDLRWFYKTCPVVAPEPSPEPKLKFCAKDVKPMGFFHNILPETGPKRLQVTFKLANICLTPENPNYPGGSWHTEDPDQ